jgi:hypothetical protein
MDGKTDWRRVEGKERRLKGWKQGKRNERMQEVWKKG